MSNVKQQFHVQKRLINGTKPHVLRSQQLLPGNVYGLHKQSEAITLEKKEVASYLVDTDGGLVYLVFDDSSTTPALVDEVARHPVSGEIQHVVFRRVNLKEAVVSDVSIETIGVNDIANTTVVLVVDSVEVESLPTDIPEVIEVDISTLTEAGQVITFGQLQLPKGVTLTIESERMGDPVVLLQEFKEEVEEEVLAEVVADVAAVEGEQTGEPTADGDQS